jgi:outer membrane protein assembly factor BamA
MNFNVLRGGLVGELPFIIRMEKWIIAIGILWSSVWLQPLLAQDSSKVDPVFYQLEVKLLDQEPRFAKKQQLTLQYSQLDSAALQVALQQIITQLQQKAYLAASVDTLFVEDSFCTAYVMVGERYEWAELKNGNVAPDFLSAIGFRERFYEQTPFYYKEVTRVQEKLLAYLEEHGYPFAQVYLDSIRISEQSITARLYYEKGPLISFDKLVIEGKSRPNRKAGGNNKVRIKAGFLSSYLGIRPNKLYNEKLVKKAQNRMDALRYLSTYQKPYVVFKEDKAALHLFVNDRPSSKIDLLLGLLPSQDPVTRQQRFDFTGNIDIDLLNPFGTGKRIQFKYQQLTLGTSDLLLRFNWPYLFRTPLGVDVAFKLYRRDSSFIDIIGDIGIQYLFNGNSYIKAFLINTTTNLINVDVDRVLQTRRLPSMLDLTNSSFGLELYYDNLDYKYNPRKGFELLATASFALKQVRPNNSIQELEDPLDANFNFATLYDTIVTNTFQYRFLLEYSQFVQILPWSTLMGRYRGGLLLSGAAIYDNETFRIGGNRILRGFDEESIFATWYNVFTLEWRFLFGRNSYAYAFGDLAYTQRQTISTQQEDLPYGFGVGVALETQIGVFALSYALGSQQGNPVLFNNGKVHFGYVYAF